ncbi:hypothetical protein C2845_PM13G01760 [Panicum miliaceum]|uniref:Uncharacterized protein n=1 Tax=Panicum miliaceum TaxID=4540 RepID=A0A3L6RFF6_PANMI|nr:hypothetical protein C2845_PM13G01760 [Panicum miliaceum]
MLKKCSRDIFEAEIEDEKMRNNLPTFDGLTYSSGTSDDDDPNAAYYYPDSDREPMGW